jgi:hypothetical protein
MATQRIVFYPNIYLCVVVKELPGYSYLPWISPCDYCNSGKKVIQKVVGVTGVEPVTLRLSSACSNQLSYTPNKVGGAEETRTPDL